MTSSFQTGALFSVEAQRRAFVERALSRVGTPYEFQGRDDFGLDCGGLVIASLEDIDYQPESPETFHQTDYPDYAHGLQDDYMERIVAGEAALIEREAMQPGDLLLFRWPGRKCAQHIGIVTITNDPHARDFNGRPASYFVHCDATEGGVVETRFDGGWLRLVTGVYRFKCWIEDGSTE